MKRYIALAIILAGVATLAFWLGYRQGYNTAYWDGFKGNLGLAHILRRAGLTPEAERQYNALSDMTIYGYFLADKSGQSKEQKEDIERLLIELIHWKQSEGYDIGPQEPLVGLTLKDNELVTESAPEPYATFKARLENFLTEHKESIQQAESTVPSKAATGASSDVR